MGTRVFNNSRNQAPPEPAAEPLPPPEPKFEPPASDAKLFHPCACGCGQVTKYTYKRGHYVRGANKLRKKRDPEPRPKGVGLFTCSNCEWFTKSCDGITEQGCNAAGADQQARPCGLWVSGGTGHFRPVSIPPRVDAIDMSEFDIDDLEILRWLADQRIREVMKVRLQRFRLGQRVTFLLNGHRHRGEIVKLTAYYVIAVDDSGTEARLKPSAVDPDVDPRASSQ